MEHFALHSAGFQSVGPRALTRGDPWPTPDSSRFTTNRAGRICGWRRRYPSRDFPAFSRNPQASVIDSVVPLEYKRLGGAPLRKPKGVAVTRREVVRRINRSLKQDDPFHLLRRARGARAQLDRGDYYVVDLIRDFVVHRDVALEAEARKRGVLADFEYLAN